MGIKLCPRYYGLSPWLVCVKWHLGSISEIIGWLCLPLAMLGYYIVMSIINFHDAYRRVLPVFKIFNKEHDSKLSYTQSCKRNHSYLYNNKNWANPFICRGMWRIALLIKVNVHSINELTIKGLLSELIAKISGFKHQGLDVYSNRQIESRTYSFSSRMSKSYNKDSLYSGHSICIFQKKYLQSQ